MAKEKRDKQGEKQQQEAKPAQAHHGAKETPRLKSRFKTEVAPALMKEFDLKNPMAVPHLTRSWSTWVSAKPRRTPRF